MTSGGATQSNGKTSVVSEATTGEALPEVGADAPAAAAVRRALRVGLERLRECDPGARRGDVESVHRMRTSARRLRSELRLYRDLLEGDWSRQLQRELQWLGRQLGAVRDADVMHDRLCESASELVGDLGPLFRALARRHEAASAELGLTLESERYRQVLERLADVAEQPGFTDAAWDACERCLPALAWKSWKRLRLPGRSLDLSDADEQYHEVRKLAKRARYSAESVAPALAADAVYAARRFARQANALQDILGEHQDATVACAEIGRVAAENSGDGVFNLAAGRLLERQAIAATAARTQFFKTWQQLDRKKNYRWMKP
jgi:CHAD domain-containing protein